MRNSPVWLRRLVVGGATTLIASTGIGLVGLASASATPGFTMTRLAGVNRFATAAAIAAQTFPSGAATVLLASGVNFPDALSGAYLAGNENGGAGAPILLTNTDSVPSETLAALSSLKAKNVIILGGTAAVSAAVETALSSTASTASGGGTLTVTRVAGPTRFDTNQAVNTQAGADTVGTDAAGAKTAILATGLNFPDALGAGALAYANHFPLLLTTDSTTVASQALAVIKADSITNVIVVGGTAVVPASQVTQLQGMGITVTRDAGPDRSATSAALAADELANFGFTDTHFNVANGFDPSFPASNGVPAGFSSDALAGSPHSGAEKAPTLITDSPTAAGSVITFVTAHNATEASGHIFGGTSAVSSALKAAITAAATTAAVTGTVTLTAATAAPGATVTGTITNPSSVTSLTVAGCGITTTAVPFNPTTGALSVTIPGTQAPGACTLTFTALNANLTSQVTPISFTVTAAVGAGTVTVTPTTTTAGGTLTGTVNTPAQVSTVSVSGCGLTNVGETFSTAGSFTFQIPATQAAGSCTLTFTSALTNGTTVTSTQAITVTAPVVTAVSTSAPDLVSAAITVPGSSSSPGTVAYTFDKTVSAAGTAGNYMLEGYSSTNTTTTTDAATAANIDPTNSDVVDVQFPPSTTPLSSYTLAVVDGGTATGAVTSGGTNPLGAVALTGGGIPIAATSGTTTGPDLVSATANVAANQATFTFDKPINTAAADIFAFYLGYYTSTGAQVAGATVVAPLPGSTASTDNVTVQFPTTTSVTNAVRYFAYDGAVITAVGTPGAGTPNPEGDTPAVATAAPDLTAVSQVNSTQYQYTFDKAVTVTNPAAFKLYEVDAATNTTTALLASAAISTGSNTVLATFAAPGTGFTVTLATVAGPYVGVLPAVTGTTAAALPNTVGAEPITPAVVSTPIGTTSGPDLRSATVDAPAGEVTYTFDKSVAGTTPVVGDFFVLNASDVTTSGTVAGSSIVSVSGDSVIVQFGPSTGPISLAGTVGAGVTAGALGTQPGTANTIAIPSVTAPNSPGDVATT